MTDCDCKTFTTHATHGDPWCQCGHQDATHEAGGACGGRTDKPKWTDLWGMDPNYLEGVPEEPTLTASEVKVLTETATRVASELALKLGRAEAAEEIAAELRRRSDIGTRGQIRAYADALAGRYATSQAPDATSDATSGVPGRPEVSEAVRSPQEPCDDLEGIAP